jgi:hypothetical protein
MSGDAPFPKQVEFWVERMVVRERDRKETWDQLEGLTRHRQEEHFAFRGDVGPGRYRLRFGNWNHLPVEPIEFTPGSTDLVVQLQAGAGLRATFLLPEGMPWGSARVALSGGGEKPRSDGDGEIYGWDRFTQEPWSQDGRRHQVHWQSLPDGTYTLEFRLWHVEAPLLAIPDVVVPPPEGGDPRLVDIDLRAHIELVNLQLLEPSGKPVKITGNFGQAIAFPLPQTAKEWRGMHLQADSANIATAKGPVDLLLVVPGYRPQEARGLRGQAQVTLQPWPEQEFVLRELPPLPAGVQIELRVEPADARGDETRFRTPWSSGSRSDLMRAPSRNVAVQDGRARLAVGDGEHRLDVRLRLERGSRSLANVTPSRFVPGPAPVEVRLPAEAVQQALEKLQGKK